MLKILHARLQHYVNRALQMFSWVRIGRGTRDQIADIRWIMERTSQKNVYLCLMTALKPLIVWIVTNWETPGEMGTPDHLTCLLRNLYVGQEATVRTLCGQLTGSGLRKAVYCHPVYLTYTQKHIM